MPPTCRLLWLEESRMTDTMMLRCPSCGATNRVPRDKVAAGRQPVCGKCKSKLTVPATATATPMTVTDATFAAEVERSPLPVLLDAWAPWCGPCRMIAPAIEELATELAGQVRVGKLNVDENPGTAGRFDIRSIPTMLVLVRGREVGRIVGAKPKAAIRAELETALTAAHDR
jgi:thioredoxin